MFLQAAIISVLVAIIQPLSLSLSFSLFTYFYINKYQCYYHLNCREIKREKEEEKAVLFDSLCLRVDCTLERVNSVFFKAYASIKPASFCPSTKPVSLIYILICIGGGMMANLGESSKAQFHFSLSR